MRRLIAVLFALILMPSTASAQTDPNAAREFIKQLSAQAVAVLNDQSMSLEEREARMRGIVDENVDILTIGRYVLGKETWADAPDGERQEYIRLFKAFLLQTYARRFGGYSGQTLSIEDAKEHGKGNAVVETSILQSGSDPIRVVWLVRDIEGQIKIRDVVVNGKSLARTQRDDFAPIVDREKLSGLLQLLRLKVSKFSAQG